ncbi:MAG: hypothetical protein HOK57_10985 [Planctomycetaceae bacterium]|jgi:hypothetical protein|nr:hypothetical protein [Planctomycetaceae bacterium]MBT6460318.1 hypothetical protein [Planctomycetaceae bacterium]MBT6643903.1 hypothetical protein [Planctomycetaceae bacterium]MBT6919339.1 hypothetical protein [Planctomycetaceae bacterium]
MVRSIKSIEARNIETQTRPSDQMRSTPPTRRKVWFEDHADELCDRDYWSCLATLWVTDYLAHDRTWWHDHLWCDRPHRSAAMTPVERAVFASINEPITLYRGYAKSKFAIGISWTDDLSVAEFFAYQFLRHTSPQASDSSGVVTCEFDPGEIALFKNENGEREFIVSEPAALFHIADQITVAQ